MIQQDWLFTYDLSQQHESSAVSSVLDILVAATGSDSGRLYGVDPVTCDLRLISARPALEDGRIPRLSFNPAVEISQADGVLLVPIRSGGKAVALLLLSRINGDAYGPAEIATAHNAGSAMCQLHSLRRENQLLEKRLAERKIMERAKGLLQLHYGWTEEDAYYHIRRTSRQQRTPMSVIAQRVIEGVAAKEVA